MKKHSFLFCSLFFLGIVTGKAQYKVLVNFTFNSGSYPGAHPYGSLILSGSTLFGMTWNGGANDSGVIFSVSTNGSNYTDLVDFTGNSGSYLGKFPFGTLILSGNTLYGMTYEGGANNDGVIFSVSTNGSNYTDLVDFTGSSGLYPGEFPQGSLILLGDTLFGMTVGGGGAGYGVIFSVSTNGSNYRDLVNFTGSKGSYPGKFPFGSLILSGNTLYGMTSQGDTNKYGNIFSVSTSGSNYTVLVNFTANSGSYLGENPQGSLILSGNTLYGMTTNGGGGGGYGVIFSVSTNGGNYTDLVNFTGTGGLYPGQQPYGSLILSGNTLYGMTIEGGAITNDGVIFSVSTIGSNYTDLVNFTGNSGLYPGEFPLGSLILSGDSLFGMTQEGGANLDGVIFRFIDTNISASINSLSPSSNSLNVYPNPSNGVFTVQSSVASRQLSVEVYNVFGEKVYSAPTLLPQSGGGLSSAYEINISSQPNGIYFYRVIKEDGGLVGEGKVIIER